MAIVLMPRGAESSGKKSAEPGSGSALLQLLLPRWPSWPYFRPPSAALTRGTFHNVAGSEAAGQLVACAQRGVRALANVGRELEAAVRRVNRFDRRSQDGITSSADGFSCRTASPVGQGCVPHTARHR